MVACFFKIFFSSALGTARCRFARRRLLDDFSRRVAEGRLYGPGGSAMAAFRGFDGVFFPSASNGFWKSMRVVACSFWWVVVLLLQFRDFRRPRKLQMFDQGYDNGRCTSRSWSNEIGPLTREWPCTLLRNGGIIL